LAVLDLVAFLQIGLQIGHEGAAAGIEQGRLQCSSCLCTRGAEATLGATASPLSTTVAVADYLRKPVAAQKITSFRANFGSIKDLILKKLYQFSLINHLALPKFHP
jgi:hypothetical protein